ncbi:sensor histidine kinase [Aquihabitans sp. McL0605]|uniref:sensor histidine kinase n=1 Tax=Aquihabitans sp. McL0605 TaxID=3415671 RepID=UPI003CF7CD1B
MADARGDGPEAAGRIPNPAAERPGQGEVGAAALSAGAGHGNGGVEPEDGPATYEGEPLSRPARGAVKLASWLPDWAGSIRFRLTALYSLLLFGLAAFMVAGLYGVLASRLHEENVYRTYRITTVRQVPGGVVLTPTEVRASYRSVEALANERALSLLRGYSLCALAILFLASLVIGWIVAGRVLAPIGRITGVAREIQATDLSRRIALRGPPDELKELADTFDAMLTRLDDAFAGQQRFIQEASHELRNPLAVIRTNLDVALADPDPDPAELRRVAELVGASATRMSRLVDDLLVYARLGAPAREVAPVALGPLVDDAVDEFSAIAATRSITLLTDVTQGGVVAGDRLALRQTVANLLANAVRLAPEGSRIWLATGTAGTQAWVTVTDEGPGIAEEDREKVFQRFWRGNQKVARAEGRSGLGLAIVAQIVHDHGGTVTVDGTPAGGSTFTLWLPLEGTRGTPVAPSDQGIEGSGGPGSQPPTS